MPGSAGDGPKTQEGTPATKDTNTTLPLPPFDPFSKQNPTAYYPRAAHVSPHFPDTAQQCTHTQCKSTQPKTISGGKNRGVGWVTPPGHAISYLWAGQTITRGAVLIGPWAAHLQICRVLVQVPQSAHNVRPSRGPRALGRGCVVCMYLHTQYAFLPSCRATLLM